MKPDENALPEALAGTGPLKELINAVSKIQIGKIVHLSNGNAVGVRHDGRIYIAQRYRDSLTQRSEGHYSELVTKHLCEWVLEPDGAVFWGKSSANSSVERLSGELTSPPVTEVIGRVLDEVKGILNPEHKPTRKAVTEVMEGLF